MSWGIVVSSAIFGTWFLLSIPYQFNKGLGKKLQELNHFSLLPGWTFFAPSPGTSDYRLVYRDVDQSGVRSEWKEIKWCQPRCALDAIWHPHRYRQKVMVDLISAFAKMLKHMKEQGVDIENNPQLWMISTPYLTFLHIAMLMPLESHTRSRQFAILEQKRWAPQEQPALVLCSSAHDVEARQP